MTKNNTKLSRRSLVSVLQEYPMPSVKPQQKQSVPEQTTGDVELNDISNNVDDLRERMKMLKNVQEQFLFACSNGSDSASLQLCSELLSVNTVKLDRITDKKNSGMSLMHILAIRNKPQTMELLAMHKLKIDSVDSIHATPLLHAAANNCTESVAFLLSKGANINAKDTWGKSPLMVALKSKHYNIAELLASQQRLDVHLRGTKGNTILHAMAADGDLTGVKLLLEKCQASPQRRNSDEENVLQVALQHPYIVQHICSKVDQTVLTKMIFNANICGHTVVHDCAQNGYTDSLISIMKSVNFSNLSADKVDLLLNTVGGEQEETPLIMAVKQNREDVVRFLCQCSEVKLNLGDVDGNTALYHAAALKYKNIVDMLTGVGALFKAENKSDELPQRNTAEQCLRSLRTLLIVLISATAFICIITIAAISIGFFASSVSRDTKLIRTKYFEEIITHISNDINAASVAHIMTFNTPGFNVTDETDVIRTTGAGFISSLQLLPLISLVACAKANTALATWIKNSRNSSQAYFTSNYANLTRSMFVTVKNLDNYLEWDPQSIIRSSTTVKGIQPYTIASMNNRGTVWTNSFTSSARLGELYIALTRGFRDPVTDEFLGSCHFDIITRGLSTYLQETAKQQANSVTVIVEGSTGLLIGTSDVDVSVLTQTVNSTVRYTNSRGLNPRMDSMLRYGRSQFGANLTNIGNVSRIYDSFYYNGQKHIFNVAEIRDPYGLHWIMLQAFPMKNLYQQFFNSIIVMICATVALMIIAVLLSVVIAAVFMRPLNILIGQTEKVKMLQLEQVEKTMQSNLSYFTEIYSLQTTFKSMASRLKQFRTFIPDHILAVIEEEIGIKKAADASSSRMTTDNAKTHSEATVSEAEISVGVSKNMVNQALNSSLVSGNVTMMVIKLPDFTRVLELHGVREIDETSKELLSELMDVVRIARGQFVSISSSKAVVAFNTFIKQNDHRLRACKAAGKCIQVLNTLREKWRVNNMPILDVSIAICSDVMYYGNMGTNRMKFFTLIGAAVPRANKMYKESAKWGSTVTVDQNVFQTATSEFDLRPLFSVEDEQNDKVQVYELGAAKPSDAWVNELGDKADESTNVWKQYIEAYKLFEDGQYDEAYELFVEYLSKNAQDVAAQNMLGICKTQKEEIGTSGNSQTDPTATVVADPINEQ